MKKINKMNINGEVYDIQDNSSGYAKENDVKTLIEASKVIFLDKDNATEEEITSFAQKILDNFSEKGILIPCQMKYKNKYYQGFNISSVYVGTDTFRSMIRVNFISFGELYGQEADGYGEVYSIRIEYFGQTVSKVSMANGDIKWLSEYQSSIYDGTALACDNTVPYTPTSDYHPAVKKYVDDKFAEAIAMGFKVEVVEALPTENISHQVIYLVLNGDDEENNIYDEFVYNSNDEWEKIGSTKTDLSNYYNKQEVDEIIKKFVFTTQQSAYDGSDECKQKWYDIYQYYLKYNVLPDVTIIDSSNSGIVYKLTSIRPSASTTYFYFNSGIQRDTYRPNNGMKYYSVTVSIVHVDNLEVMTSIKSVTNGGGELAIPYQAWGAGALYTTNTYEYTPTQPYHPSTKKYVDDQVGAINEILATLTTVEESEVSE